MEIKAGLPAADVTQHSTLAQTFITMKKLIRTLSFFHILGSVRVRDKGPFSSAVQSHLCEYWL